MYYYVMTRIADLTPFGFTPTESHVYAALLRLGPATGYAVAHAARLARANAYGALAGLVSRGAATRGPGRPVRYRPADPRTLLAQLAAEQGEALERLARALADTGGSPDLETRTVAGERAIANLITQLVARAEQQVAGILSHTLARPTLPAWRRAGQRARLELRIAGVMPPEFAALAAGTVSEDAPTVILVDDRETVAVAADRSAARAGGGATIEGGEALSAIWSSHPAIAMLARRALGSEA